MYNIPLEQVIKNQITVQDYFDLMRQILMDLEETRRSGTQVVLDRSRMSIKDGKLWREIEQTDGICEVAEIRNFLKEITFDSIFQLNENCSSVTKFLQMMDSVSELNFFGMMIQFCEVQLGLADPMPNGNGRSQTGRTIQPQMFQGGDNGETGVLSDDFWNKLERQNQGGSQAGYQSQGGNQMGYQGQGGSQMSYQGQGGYTGYDGGMGYEAGGSNGETGVLDPGFWQHLSQGTPNPGPQRPSVGRLVHAKTGNVTVINKENFWIGKGEVDLKIEKDTVSRKHAQILVRQNHYFISDNGSTNKTYVEGKEISPNASVELYNGMHVKFANEEYIFQI